MQEEVIFKYLGFIAVVFFLAAVFVILKMANRDPGWSLSQHAASSKKIFILYEAALSLSIILLYLFFIKWFIPHFELSNIFKILISCIAILQLLGNFLPDRSDASLLSRLHRFFYYFSASLLPILLFMIVQTLNFSNFSRLLAIFAILVSLVFMGLFFFFKKTHQKYLWYQITYYCLFLGVICSITILE